MCKDKEKRTERGEREEERGREGRGREGGIDTVVIVSGYKEKLNVTSFLCVEFHNRGGGGVRNFVIHLPVRRERIMSGPPPRYNGIPEHQLAHTYTQEMIILKSHTLVLTFTQVSIQK